MDQILQNLVGIIGIAMFVLGVMFAEMGKRGKRDAIEKYQEAQATYNRVIALIDEMDAAALTRQDSK